MSRIPTNRPPTHPGEMLMEEYLKPLGLTQVETADKLGVPFQRINQIIRGRRAVTPDTALRLSRLLGTTPGFWLNLQTAWDLYHAMRSRSAKAIAQIRPVARKAS